MLTFILNRDLSIIHFEKKKIFFVDELRVVLLMNFETIFRILINRKLTITMFLIVNFAFDDELIEYWLSKICKKSKIWYIIRKKSSLIKKKKSNCCVNRITTNEIKKFFFWFDRITCVIQNRKWFIISIKATMNIKWRIDKYTLT